MINSVCLTGRITKDLELKQTNSSSILNCTLAVDRRFKQENQPDADFIQCVAFGKTAELMSQYLHKGSLIGVEGRIQTRSYENQNGQRVYVTEVVISNVSFLESRNQQNQQTGYQAQAQSTYQNPYKQPQQQQTYQYPQNPTQGRPFGNPYSQYVPQQDDEDDFPINSDDLPF